MLLSAVLLGACAAAAHHPGSSADQRSNAKEVFKVCRTDEECGSELECFCGICTKRCDEDHDCAALSTNASCMTSIPLTRACGSFDAPLSLHPACAIACGGDADCRALGPAARCSAEWCRQPNSPSVLDGSDTRSCVEREQALRQIIAPALAAADRFCTTAADCVVTPVVNACYGDFCMRVFTSRAGDELLRSALSQLESKYCDDVLDAGCAGPGERPSCPGLRAPMCIDGRCGEP